MAGQHIVINVRRPDKIVLDGNGETLWSAPDDAVLVDVERYAGSREITAVRLNFADYPGLEAELAAEESTTVLDAALNTALTSITWPADSKPAVQRAYLGDVIDIA